MVGFKVSIVACTYRNHFQAAVPIFVHVIIGVHFQINAKNEFKRMENSKNSKLTILQPVTMLVCRSATRIIHL